MWRCRSEERSTKARIARRSIEGQDGGNATKAREGRGRRLDGLFGRRVNDPLRDCSYSTANHARAAVDDMCVSWCCSVRCIIVVMAHEPLR